jgi:hypothetical protein
MLNKGSGHVHGLSFLPRGTALQLGANMSICLDFPILPIQSFVVVFVLFVVVFVMCACRNRKIYFNAEVILFPASTAYFYFLSLISTFLSFEVVSHRQVFR